MLAIEKRVSGRKPLMQRVGRGMIFESKKCEISLSGYLQMVLSVEQRQ